MCIVCDECVVGSFFIPKKLFSTSFVRFGLTSIFRNSCPINMVFLFFFKPSDFLVWKLKSLIDFYNFSNSINTNSDFIIMVWFAMISIVLFQVFENEIKTSIVWAYMWTLMFLSWSEFDLELRTLFYNNSSANI